MLSKGYLLALPILLSVVAEGAAAQGYSLLTGSGLVSTRDPDAEDDSPFGAPRQPLIQARAEIPDTAAAEAARGRAQSLFIGQASHGFFAPFAPRDPGATGGDLRAYAPVLAGEDQLVMLRTLIASAEAGSAGYDAVQHGARIKPSGLPTQMTLGDIFAWIKATPGQPHAIGRYQFIPSTLARLVTILDAGPEERFSPQMQDRLADILLQDAGYDSFRTGQTSRTAFMNNLAKIWAGLPNSSGRSHYHGYAGNAATMSWSNFDSEMARIFQS